MRSKSGVPSCRKAKLGVHREYAKDLSTSKIGCNKSNSRRHSACRNSLCYSRIWSSLLEYHTRKAMRSKSGVPSCKKLSWDSIESMQKIFLETKLDVRNQTPYVILLAEIGCIPLESEAFYLNIIQVKIWHTSLESLVVKR